MNYELLSEQALEVIHQSKSLSGAHDAEDITAAKPKK